MSITYFEPETDQGQEVLQHLYDQGLLWAMNHAVLHRFGYAVGVVSSKETTEVVERLIFIELNPEDEDVDGEMIFSGAAGLKGYKKFLDFQASRFDNSKRQGAEMDQEGEVHE